MRIPAPHGPGSGRDRPLVKTRVSVEENFGEEIKDRKGLFPLGGFEEVLGESSAMVRVAIRSPGERGPNRPPAALRRALACQIA